MTGTTLFSLAAITCLLKVRGENTQNQLEDANCQEDHRKSVIKERPEDAGIQCTIAPIPFTTRTTTDGTNGIYHMKLHLAETATPTDGQACFPRDAYIGVVKKCPTAEVSHNQSESTSAKFSAK